MSLHRTEAAEAELTQDSGQQDMNNVGKVYTGSQQSCNRLHGHIPLSHRS